MRKSKPYVDTKCSGWEHCLNPAISFPCPDNRHVREEPPDSQSQLPVIPAAPRHSRLPSWGFIAGLRQHHYYTALFQFLPHRIYWHNKMACFILLSLAWFVIQQEIIRTELMRQRKHPRLFLTNVVRRSKRTSPLLPILCVLSHMTLTEVRWGRSYFSHLSSEEITSEWFQTTCPGMKLKSTPGTIWHQDLSTMSHFWSSVWIQPFVSQKSHNHSK